MRKLRYLILLILVVINTQTWGQVISTNISNGNLYVYDQYNNYGYMQIRYGRLGATNQITVADGKQLLIHGVNISPIDRNASQAFIRKKNPSGETFTIGLSKTNANFISDWNGPIVGPMLVEYGLDGVIASYTQSYLDLDSTFLKTYCDFLLEVKDSALKEISSNISSTSVVVPSNAVGDVDVLLEQSNDMITWTQCLPGTYNASTQKRFFRLRAVEK
jgi:hypothetical protein